MDAFDFVSSVNKSHSHSVIPTLSSSSAIHLIHLYCNHTNLVSNYSCLGLPHSYASEQDGHTERHPRPLAGWTPRERQLPPDRHSSSGVHHEEARPSRTGRTHVDGPWSRGQGAQWIWIGKQSRCRSRGDAEEYHAATHGQRGNGDGGRGDAAEK